MAERIAVLAGDGIGPEVMAQALRVLEAVGGDFELLHCLAGGAAFEKEGSHLPAATISACRSSRAVLFGSVGGPLNEADLPKWRGCEANSILALRKELGLYANLRPVRVYPELADICPVKIAPGSEVDIVIVRELQGDIYFGARSTRLEAGERVARDEAIYSEGQIRDVARAAFDLAARRKGKLVSVDKANVLDTSRLWRAVVNEVAKEYPACSLEHILVDNCAMQLVRQPAFFDVLLAPNMFGDILSDLGAVLPGSLGLTPSASLSVSGPALYEPSGGSAPDIAGKGSANPVAQILSVAMMLRHSFARERDAMRIERAVEVAFRDGYRTADISGGSSSVTTRELTDRILERL